MKNTWEGESNDSFNGKSSKRIHVTSQLMPLPEELITAWKVKPADCPIKWTVILKVLVTLILASLSSCLTFNENVKIPHDCISLIATGAASAAVDSSVGVSRFLFRIGHRDPAHCVGLVLFGHLLPHNSFHKCNSCPNIWSFECAEKFERLSHIKYHPWIWLDKSNWSISCGMKTK